MGDFSSPESPEVSFLLSATLTPLHLLKVLTPTVWKELPLNIRTAHSKHHVKKLLTTHVYREPSALMHFQRFNAFHISCSLL